MDRFLRGFIFVEKSKQIITIIGLMLWIGYLGFSNIHSTKQPSVQVTTSTTVP